MAKLIAVELLESGRPGLRPQGVTAATIALVDGLAVQVTLHDPHVPRERMLRCALEMAESLLDCELGAAAYETAVGDGSGDAVRETAPHLADTERRRGIE